MSAESGKAGKIRGLPSDTLEVKGTKDYLPREQLIRESIAGVMILPGFQQEYPYISIRTV